MTIDLEDLKDWIDSNTLRYVHLYDSYNNRVFTSSDNADASFYTNLYGFLKRFPGVYKGSFRPGATSPTKAAHTIWINASEGNVDAPEVHRPEAGAPAPPADVTGLYEKVRNDVLGELKTQQEIHNLKTELQSVRKENKEYEGAANKFASAMEQLVINLASKGRQQVQMQGLQTQKKVKEDTMRQPQGSPDHIETSLERKRRLKNQGTNPGQNNNAPPADPPQMSEKDFELCQQKFAETITILKAYDNDIDIADKLLTLAEKCRQHPQIWDFINNDNLDFLAAYLKNQ